MDIIISCSRGQLNCGSLSAPVRIGKAGYVEQVLGREGDAKTPLGDYHLRFGLYRADRLPMPKSRLTFRALQEDDGWCDAPGDAGYNRFVKRPYPASHEALWREDGVYDIILVLSHNDSPPQNDTEGRGMEGRGMGSAVFIHVAHIDDRQTMGCVALSADDMAKLLGRLYTGQKIIIED